MSNAQVRIKVKIPDRISLDALRTVHGFGTSTDGCENGEVYLICPIPVSAALSFRTSRDCVVADMAHRIMALEIPYAVNDMAENPDAVLFAAALGFCNETKSGRFKALVNGQGFSGNMLHGILHFTREDSDIFAYHSAQLSRSGKKPEYSDYIKHVRIVDPQVSEEMYKAADYPENFYEAFVKGEGVGYIIG